MSAAGQATLALDDVQGLLRFGYKHHVEACFLLLRLTDRAAALAWLAAVPVTSAVTVDPPPQTAVQVAFTSDGLSALGVPRDVIEGFSDDFVSGMGGSESRSRRLGDIGADAPANWQWGVGARAPHVVVLLYAYPGRLEGLQRSIETDSAAGFERLACLPTSNLDGFEPFGFMDGISQPDVDWERRRAVSDADRLAYSNLACLGEFVLGYPNEYGGYTDRPLLDPSRDSQGLLPRAEDAPDHADLGRNGTYVVLRQLRQDVHSFWQFVDRAAGGDAAARERLAAAMVGRTMQGEPLVGTARRAIPGAQSSVRPEVSKGAPDLNSFDFSADPRGVRCPLGAHIRRSNPRNADLPPGRPGLLSRLERVLGFDADALTHDLVASTRFHRLLRRGREYGPGVSVAEALAGSPSAGETGLHFICLGANLARQFEFVQAAWIAAPKFDGLPDEGDPLLGSREPTADGTPTDGFSLPQENGPDRRITGLPRFVTLVGGAYFFLPGIRALRWIASQGGSQ